MFGMESSWAPCLILLYIGGQLCHNTNACGLLDQNEFCGSMIHSLFHKLVVNVGTYLPKKGKVCENNGCREARLIFAELPLLMQVRLSTNAVNKKKKKQFQIFSTGKIFTVTPYLPLDVILKITIYLIWACWIQNRTTFQSNNRHFEIET